MKSIGEFDEATALRLKRFLAAPERPEDTMNYHELAGFIYSLACAPQMVPPSEWLAMVFNDEDAGYRDEREAQAVFGDILAFYNHVNEQVNAGEPRLPADCEIRTPATANLDDDAPLSQWARGFLTGHNCLYEMWDTFTPESLDEDLGSCLMVLSFFASRKLAEDFREQVEGDHRQSLQDMAETVAGLVPDALVEYAHLGWSIRQVLNEEEAAERTPHRVEKIGRNDLCPCGSGKKYKKCCGAVH